MVIRLDKNYNAMTSTALLGYVGETNARPVSVEGMEIDGADRYVLSIDYGDGTVYEVDITGGQWTPTADILRSAQTVSCQICAKKLSGQEYILLKKSRIFRLRIGAAIGDTAIPSPSVAADALDRIDAIGRQAHTDMQTAVTAAETATTAAENAKKSATAAEKSADTTEQAASRAETAKTAAETAAQTAQSIADSLPEDYTTAVGKIAENTAEIGRVKLTDKELQRRVNALYDIGQGITHRFETDSETAYAKTVPTGGKLMSVKLIGGHSEVIDGEIVSAGTESIIEQGRNLWNEVWGVGSINSSSGNNEFSKEAIYSKNYTPIAPNSTHIFVYAGSAKFENVKTRFYDYNKNYIGYNDKDGQTVYPNKKFITPSDAFYVRFTLPPSYGNVYKNDIALIAGSSGSYTPYHQTWYPIPEAIRALTGYGWSAGNAKNYVDYENKKYVQCVSSVDLGTLDWEFNTTSAVGHHFYAPAKHLNFKYLGIFGTTVYNALCSKYRTVARSSNVFVDKTLTIDGATVVSQIQVKDTAYPDATAFKQAMSGVILYYEIANPVVTDISSLIPDDFLRNIEVEALGSITFKNSDENYRIPVPSEEEYVVKLSEVGGTT
jgi:hypothetical protein